MKIQFPERTKPLPSQRIDRGHAHLKPTNRESDSAKQTLNFVINMAALPGIAPAILSRRSQVVAMDNYCIINFWIYCVHELALHYLHS